MSLGMCIPDMLAKGEIDAEQAAQMGELFTELERHYTRQMGQNAAAAMAGQDTLKQLAAIANLKKRRALLQVQAQRQTWLDMQNYGLGAGNVRVLDPKAPNHLAKAAEAKFVRSEYAPYRNAEYQVKIVRDRAHGMAAAILEKHSRNIIGEVRNKAELRDIMRELKGETTGNANARELAGAWLQTAEDLRLRFNAAGGDIGPLDNWGLPQSHDSKAIGAVPFAEWRDFISDKLDLPKITDRMTGLPISPEKMELVLRSIYETVRTEGWNARTPGSVRESSLASRHQDSRFLVFKSADDWLDYSEKFGGKSNVFDAMMAHIDSMSRDIGLMEVFGPNPAAYVRWLGDTVEKQARLTGTQKHIDAAFATRSRIERFYKELSGGNNRPENPDLALIGSGLRSFQVATKLGSATLSSISDQATLTLARRMNGLPVLQGVQTQLKLLNPLDAADRELAVRMMLSADTASGMAASTARMTGEELTGEVSRRTAEFVLRASGLNALTESGRHSFGLDFWSHITHERGKSWDALDPAFRNSFERYGMGQSHWDALRATELVEAGGARWITAGKIGNRGLADDVMRMIRTEMDFAVPMPGVRMMSAINSTLARGTIVGEIGRSMFQFKSFAVGIAMDQGGRILAQRGWNKARYAAQMVILTTILGVVALQLKEISKGRDPQPVWDKAFLGQAFLQGGGAGIFGDFLKSQQSRTGGGIGSVVLGPSFQTVDALANLTVKPALQAAAGEDVNYGRNVIKALKSETPGGTIWYGRLAFERLILDNVQEMIDPKYQQARRTLERNAEEADTAYYWEPGVGLGNARAPDVSNMAADTE